MLGSAYIIYILSHRWWLRSLVFSSWFFVFCFLRGLAHCLVCSAVSIFRRLPLTSVFRRFSFSYFCVITADYVTISPSHLCLYITYIAFALCPRLPVALKEEVSATSLSSVFVTAQRGWGRNRHGEVPHSEAEDWSDH